MRTALGRLSKRDKNAGKNRFGHLLFGTPGKTGRCFAAFKAMRAGAGLVTVAGDSRTADLLEELAFQT